MKTHVFVLIPYDVEPAAIGEYLELAVEKHRFDDPDRRARGRFDHLRMLGKTLHDRTTDDKLPIKVRAEFSGHICEWANLPSDRVPGALLTPDGEWHDLEDFGFEMIHEDDAHNQEARARWTVRYRQLMAQHPDCWVTEVWSHS